MLRKRKYIYRRYKTGRIVAIIVCFVLFLLLFVCYTNWKEFYYKNRKLTFSHCDIENQQLYKKLTEAYEKSNEGISFEISTEPEETFASLLSEGKRLPDIFAITEDMDFSQLVSDKKLRDLSECISVTEAGGCGAQQAGAKDGKIWAIPLTYRIPVIFYNAELFDLYNLNVPENISDFVRLCSVLQIDDAFPFAMSLDETGRWDADNFAEGVLVNSADSGGLFTANGDLNPGFYDLLGLSHELADKIPVKAKSPHNGLSLLEGFARGKYAMVPGTTDDIELLKKYDDFRFGFFIMPGSCGNDRAAVKSNMMLGISRKTKLSREAEDYIAYLLSEHVQGILASELKELPVHKNPIIEDEILKKSHDLSLTVQQQPGLLANISSEQKGICRNMLDAIFSDAATDPDVFIADWAERLKNTPNEQ